MGPANDHARATIRVIRAIRGLPTPEGFAEEGDPLITSFPRRAFGKRDRSATDPKSDRA